MKLKLHKKLQVANRSCEYLYGYYSLCSLKAHIFTAQHKIQMKHVSSVIFIAQLLRNFFSIAQLLRDRRGTVPQLFQKKCPRESPSTVPQQSRNSPATRELSRNSPATVAGLLRNSLWAHCF
jgi:hypothetical protein